MQKRYFIKKYLFLSAILLAAIYATEADAQQQPVGFSNRAGIADSLIFPEKNMDTTLEAIVKTQAPPPAEKVQYVSQLTKYGFKNLFTSFSYNSALPYSSQVNPYAENYMQDYLKSHGTYLKNMKSWAMPYFNLIDHIFSQYGLPKELKYLAVIESNLKTGATSSVGAGGPWQFMPYTARDYGLIVNNQRDDRRDYFKSTHAAARYLLYLYQQMHDWLLVIAAYNGGPGRVYEAIKKSGSRNFWSLQYYLPTESRNHVKKFIATHYIMETYNGNGMVTDNGKFYQPTQGSNPYNQTTKLTAQELAEASVETISGKYLARIISQKLDMEPSLFNRYNPDFDKNISLNGQYVLRLPPEKMQLFLTDKYDILNACVQAILNDGDIPNNKTSYPTTKPKRSL